MTDPSPSLRDVLIDAGMALLAEGGMPALTLRRAAARAGVSHAAPAHHFDGLPGLLTAIAGRAFAHFSEAMAAEARAADPDPFSQLLSICQGYLAFATTDHGLFHVMFVSPEVDRSHPELTPHSTRAYLLLRQACLPFAPPGATADLVLETAVWSLVHGYTALGFRPTDQGRFAPPPPFDTLLREMLNSRRNPLAPAVGTR